MKLGIIGTGRIANRFVPENKVVDKFEIVAVYNPRLTSAEQFAEKWSIELSTNKWDEFCDKVDAVYVASPHHTHYEYTRNLLLAGKHVLCEKPLCMSGKEAKELFALADERRLALMEAVKTAYCPGFMELIRVAKSGVIGEIKDVEACFTKLADREGRELNSATYAGSFYEMGTYALLPAMKLLGKPKDVYVQTIRVGERNADGFAKVHLVYEDAFALAKTGLAVKSEGCLIVSGTKGYILVRSPWWLTKEFEVCFENPAENKKHKLFFEGDGLRYEIRRFRELISDKEFCSSRAIALTPEESIWMAEIMEQFADGE